MPGDEVRGAGGVVGEWLMGLATLDQRVVIGNVELEKERMGNDE